MCCPEPPSLSLYLPSSPPEVRLVMLNARKQAANLLEEGTRPERLSEHWTGHTPVSGHAGDEQGNEPIRVCVRMKT
jgi:hypothetical protein